MTGKRQSKKRDAILDAVRSTDTHPSAEWVFEKIRGIYPELSLATVYRNLSALKDDGVIASVAVVDGKERFDRCISPHVHFICSECGRVMDVPVSETDAEKYKDVEILTGGKVSSHSLIYRGICRDCCE